MNGSCPAFRKRLGPWGSPKGGAQSLGAIGSICLSPRAGRNLCPYGLLRARLLREGGIAGPGVWWWWWWGMARFLPSQVPNLPGGKVGGVDETTCSSCTPGGVFESNPGLEGPAWSLRLTALGVWRARRRRAASLSRVPGTPTFHVLLRPFSDSCVAQVPPPPSPHTRNAAFEVILPAGLGVLEARCPG